MPKPDPESHLLVNALNHIGLTSEIIPWDSDINWERFSLVVIRTPWDYFQRLEEFLSWLPRVDAVTKLTNPRHLIEWNCHKGYLQQLADAGLPTVPTTWLTRHCSNPAEILKHDTRFADWRDIVIKPAVSIGAIDTLRTHTGSLEGMNHIINLLGKDDVLIQPFLSDIMTGGEVSLIFFGTIFSHAVRKIPRAGDFRVQDLYGGSVYAHAASQEEIALARNALEATPAPSSYARVDLVMNEGRQYIMEVELIEPELFFATNPAAAFRFAETLSQLISQ